MSRAPSPAMASGAPGPVARWRVPAVAAILILAAVGAYWNSFNVPFLLDDQWAVTENPSIHHLGRVGEVLSPPTTGTTSARPLLNLTFALNYAWGGLSVRGYHAVNLLIHICAGLVLLGIVRRTLLLPGLWHRYGEAALPLAAFAALLWTLHPLQTESVTYISQRAESLMGLFYLLTLYGFIRSAVGRGRHTAPDYQIPPLGGSNSNTAGFGDPALQQSVGGGSKLWLGLSVAACFCGMATKQVMVTAPLLVLLYDRAYVSESFRSALVNRRWYYSSLAATWIWLGFLMHHWSLAEISVGFQERVSWLTYALTELRVVADYLKLTFWPHPLVFDYGSEILMADPLAIAPYALIVVAILFGVVISWRKSPKAGFLGGCFFLILAPTSTVVPIAAQPMAESRMYLPLAAVVVLVALGCYSLGRRRALFVLGIVVVGLGVLTVRRNFDYRSTLSIWDDTLAKHPDSSRGHNNLGTVLLPIPGRSADAIAQFEEALRLEPTYVEAHNNLATELAKIPGRSADAIAHYEEAIRLKPDYVEAHSNLSLELAKIPGRLPDAIAHGEEALRLKPIYAEAHNNLAIILAKMPGRLADAIAHYEEAIRQKPEYPEAHNNLALELAKIPGRLPDAIAHYEEALRLNPTYAEAHCNLADELAEIPDRLPDAIAHYETALRLKPDFIVAHNNLAVALAKIPYRLPEAIAHYEAALRLKADFAEAHGNLADALAKMPGRLPDAIAHYEAALRLKPDYVGAHNNLALELAKIPGRLPDAIAHYEAALRLQPDLAELHNNLAKVLEQISGRLPDAIAHYEAAVRLKPDLVEARNNLAVHYAETGRLDAAIKQLEIAARLDPASTAVRDNLEKLKARQKQ